MQRINVTLNDETLGLLRKIGEQFGISDRSSTIRFVTAYVAGKELTMKTVTVYSTPEMEKTLRAHDLTTSPIPTGDAVEIPERDLRIERGMRETSFYGCNHGVSTTRFSKEQDYCSVCDAIRKVR